MFGSKINCMNCVLSWEYVDMCCQKIKGCHGYQVVPCTLWQYGLWSFQTVGTKLKRFLPKNQHTQRKLLKFENWVNGEVSNLENLGG